MYVLVNVQQGQELIDLMTILTEKVMTFSVTDDIKKILLSAVSDRIDVSTQTEEMEEESLTSEISVGEAFEMMQRRMQNDFGEYSYDAKTSDVSSSLAAEEMTPVKAEPDEMEMPNEEMQAHLMKALFSREEKKNVDEIFEEIEEEQNDACGSNLRNRQEFVSKKRGVCQVCKREVSVISTHKRRHAITHLGFKTLRCQICHKYFSRQDLCGPHFKKDHPDSPVIQFEDMMSLEDVVQLKNMLNLCFPKSPKKAKY